MKPIPKTKKHDIRRLLTRDLVFRTKPQEKLDGIKRTASQIENQRKK